MSDRPAFNDACLPLPSAEERAFRRLRGRLLWRMAHHACAEARLRTVLIVLLSLVLWGILFAVAWDGFRFLRDTIPSRELYEQIVRVAFGMFFAALFVMLVFSAAILLYGSLFCGRETQFLLALPARVERVFAYRFQEALVLSSWGFLLLGSPVLAAYGLAASAPWGYYVLMPFYLVAFVYTPAALGAIACLAVVHRLTRRRLSVTVAGAAGLAALVGALGWMALGGRAADVLTPAWLDDVLGRLQITQQRLFPSWWLTCGLLGASRRQWAECLPFLAVLASNAFLFRLLAVKMSGWSLRPALSAIYGAGGARRRTRLAPLDRALLRAGRALPTPMRLFFLKDFRMFRRDPVQWSQFLIFFGLLGLYFLNIRRFTSEMQHAGWVHMVSFLNLAVVGMLLSTFNTRFVFPMVSLEGRRFWILGLLPLERRTILWSKFAFAVIACALPSSLLVLLSDAMLDVGLLIMALHQLTCGLLSCGLAGIAVGLGAAFPHPREQSPARIAAGYGGTLNLVVSTGYILLIVLLTALPSHSYFVMQGVHRALAAEQTRAWFHWGMAAGTAASLILAALATYVPLRIGFRAFDRMEIS